MPRDGLQYTLKDHKPIGHKYPWGAGPGRLHWNCRSTSTPVVKSWKPLTGVDAEDFSPTTRATMDGQVAASLTFGEWLKKQSAERQDEVLGPSRAALFRKGKLSIDRFFNDRGRLLRLDELAERSARAFVRAGVEAAGRGDEAA